MSQNGKKFGRALCSAKGCKTTNASSIGIKSILTSRILTELCRLSSMFASVRLIIVVLGCIILENGIDDRYDIRGTIGQGAYGTVFTAIHKPTGRPVAIKKMVPFRHPVVCLRTLRELKLLKLFACAHENIVSILDVLKPPSLDSFRELYVVRELMAIDLHSIIRSQDLTDEHCQYFIYQTIRALKFIHSAGIVHRDLKPSNLLVNANCDLKVCDFGLASSVYIKATTDGECMTEYVATRWYRAPEIMLSFRKYTTAIDLWATGCILAELILRQPLFPGRHYVEQLRMIIGVLGKYTVERNRYSPVEQISHITRKSSRQFLRTLPLSTAIPMQSLFPSATASAIDLLQKLLTFDPRKRLSAIECITHQYLELYHDPEDEPDCLPPDSSYLEFDLDGLLYEEVMSFVPAI
ncbi:kinase-like domain-containing protein [Mycena galericulata]|nr:kinase-like domain-containing protein [Mycena galericulata]